MTLVRIIGQILTFVHGNYYLTLIVKITNFYLNTYYVPDSVLYTHFPT